MSVDRKTLLLDWATRLRAISATAPRKNFVAGGFSDEAGHRRTVDQPLLAWRRFREVGDAPSPWESRSPEPDVLLWQALTDPSIDPWAALPDAQAARGGQDRRSLLPISGSAAIEVWTERELAALHALWWHARLTRNATFHTRLESSAAWHIEHLQPDNATAHPWAIHVFLDHACREPVNHDIRLYAETQLHNCRVSLGYPDALSALILIDAADALESLAGEASVGHGVLA